MRSGKWLRWIAVLAALLIPERASAIAYVQTVTGQTAVAAATVSAVLTGGVAGHGVIVTIMLNSSLAGAGTVTQTTGDALTLTSAVIDNGGTYQAQYRDDNISGTLNTYTFTWTNNTLATIFVTEVSGQKTSGSFDQFSSTTQTTATTHASGTTPTLSQAAEIAIASFNADSSGSTAFTSATNGYTVASNLIGSGVTGVRGIVLYLVTAATTATSTTITTDNVIMTGLIGTYEDAGSVAAPKRLTTLGIGDVQ
jgi:hypothetical protein